MDEFVERAVSMPHEQEVWLTQNPQRSPGKIEEGCAAAERGELLDPAEARAKLDQLKRSVSNKT